jgi:hypothetical protein
LFEKQYKTLLKIRQKIIETSIELGEKKYGDDYHIIGYQELIDNLENQDNRSKHVNKSGQMRMKLNKDINKLKTKLKELEQQNAINEGVIKNLETQKETAISTGKVTEDDFFMKSN